MWIIKYTRFSNNKMWTLICAFAEMHLIYFIRCACLFSRPLLCVARVICSFDRRLNAFEHEIPFYIFCIYIFNEFTTWLSRSLGLYLKFETRCSSNGFRSLFYIDREKIKSRALAKRQLFNLCSNWSRLRDKSNNRCCKCSSINDERMRADA